MTAISEIGIEKVDAIYSPASVLYFTKNDENSYNFIIESRGQLKEDVIFRYGIDTVVNQLEELTDINDLNDIKKQKGTMKLIITSYYG